MEGQGAEEHPQQIIRTDGSSNRQVGRVGVMLHSLEGDEIECMVRLNFLTTNNNAEYEVLVARLDLTKVAGETSVIVYCDSQVVTSQVNGDFECKGEKMKKYLEQVRRRVGELQAKFVRVPREENEKADHLTKVASVEYMLIPSKVFSFIQFLSLIDDVNVQEIDSRSNWTTLIFSYLKNGTLLDSKEAARKLKVQAA